MPTENGEDSDLSSTQGRPLPEEEGQIVEDEDALIHALVERGREESSSSTLDLTREQEEELAARIVMDFDDAEANMSIFKERHAVYTESWRGVVQEKNFPFTNAANIRVPLTSVFIEQMKARLFKAMLGGQRIAEFSSLDDSIKREELEEVSDWFKYELDEIVNLEEAVQHLLHDVLVDGIGLPVALYSHEEKRLCSKREFDIAENTNLTEQLLTAINLLFENEDPLPVMKSPGVFEVNHKTKESDERKLADVSFCIQQEKIVAKVERQETVFDGVRLEKVNLEDLVVINSDTSIEGIPFFGCRLWISCHDFINGVKSGFYRDFDDDELNEILAHASNKQGEVIQQLTTDVGDEEEGTESKDQSGVDYSRRWLEVYRWEGRWSRMPALKKDEKPVQDLEEQIGVATWCLANQKRIIRHARLEELNKDGERTPVKFDFIVQPDRFFSIGLVEWLRHVQAEIDGIHNQRLDAGLLSNVPFFFYVPSAGLQHTVLSMEPGKGYPIKDANGVVFPKTNWEPFWSFQEEANVRKYAQEQAGLGEPSTGSFLSKRTSATEFQATTGAIDLRTEYIVSGIYRSLRKLLYRIFGLYQQYAQDGRVFQTTGLGGERVVKRLKRDRLHGKLVLHLTSNIQQLSAQLERDIAVNMLSLFMNEILIQMGIVKPDTIFAAIEKVVRASGYKGVPVHRPDTPPESDSPQIEHKRMLLGETVQPSPTENFNEHLQAHLALASNPNFTKYFPTQESQQLLAAHIQQTVQMQQVVALLRQQQAQQAAMMRGNMAEMGVRPGLAGGQQTGQQAEPATAQEGVEGAPNE